jgi:hypothetical protein
MSSIFLTVDDVTAAFPGFSQSLWVPSQTAEGSGFWSSLWLADRQPGGAGVQPAAGGEAYTAASTGALPVGYTAGRTCFGLLELSCPSSGQVMFYDRLVAMSGLSGTLLTPQTVTLPTLPRYADGVGVEAYLEWYVVTGATARNLTVVGTDHNGDAMTVTVLVPGGPTDRQKRILPAAPGKLGWRTITSVTWDASTGTSGNFGITLGRPITKVSVGAGFPGRLDFLQLGLTEFLPGACLAISKLCSENQTGNLSGQYVVLNG